MTERDYYDSVMLSCDGCGRLPYQGVMEGTAADLEPNTKVPTEGGDIDLCPKCKKEHEEEQAACTKDNTSASETNPSSPIGTTSG